MRASAVVNCRSALMWLALRSLSQAATYLDESLFVRDPPIEALAGQDAQLCVGNVQPTAVLGRTAPLQPLDEAARLRCREGFVERRWLVGAEIVLHERDLVGAGEVLVGQVNGGRQ
jgi:hypothetical protein